MASRKANQEWELAAGINWAANRRPRDASLAIRPGWFLRSLEMMMMSSRHRWKTQN